MKYREMHHIVILERDSVRADFRRPNFAHEWVEYPSTTPTDMHQRLAQATIAISNKVPLRGDLLEKLPRLKMIAVSATGTDHIDLEVCRSRGIVVSNIRGYAVHAVPEHVLMLILALRRQVISYRDEVSAGRWQKSPVFCLFGHAVTDLHGATLGLIGRGALGQGVARIAEAFGMRVLWGERRNAAELRPGYVAFETLLAEVDVISLHCPLTLETRGLIGMAELRAMKRSAILINASRGGLVDEAALAAALRQQLIAGAGFDVLSVEPPQDDNPLLAADILALPNFILTPHVAWSSNTAMDVLADQLIDNIEAFVRGVPQNRVA
jgi:glycerate dehydrogenase